MNEIYVHALKLLGRRDYAEGELRRKLEHRFGSAPEHVLAQLREKNFINDRRFAENYVRSRKIRGPETLRDELVARGISTDLAEQVLAETDWPSLREMVTAKMNDWKLRAPLQPRDTARLFRAMLRLGYEEDAIREEVNRHNDQQ